MMCSGRGNKQNVKEVSRKYHIFYSRLQAHIQAIDERKKKYALKKIVEKNMSKSI